VTDRYHRQHYTGYYTVVIDDELRSSITVLAGIPVISLVYEMEVGDDDDISYSWLLSHGWLHHYGPFQPQP
jgi:hypothetical protein